MPFLQSFQWTSQTSSPSSQSMHGTSLLDHPPFRPARCFSAFLRRCHRFCRAWCDRHGDGVITAAKKEFKGHVEEMEKQRDINDSEGWATFDDIDLDDNFNPRAFSQHQYDSDVKGNKVNQSLTSSFTNPFYNDKNPFLNTNYN